MKHPWTTSRPTSPKDLGFSHSLGGFKSSDAKNHDKSWLELSIFWVFSCRGIKACKRHNVNNVLKKTVWSMLHCSRANVWGWQICFFPKAQPKGSLKELVHRWPPTTDHSKMISNSWLTADHQPLTTASWPPTPDHSKLMFSGCFLKAAEIAEDGCSWKAAFRKSSSCQIIFFFCPGSGGTTRETTPSSCRGRRTPGAT